MMRAALVVLLALLLPMAGAGHLSAQEYTLEDIRFLSGCWAGEMGSIEMMEQWSGPEGGAVLGTTRYLRDGVLSDFEFGMFVEDEEGVTLWPYPRGQRSERGFPLVRVTGDEVVFENLEHDFPVRIVYAKDGDEVVNPRIEGRDGSSRGWTMTRVACPE